MARIFTSITGNFLKIAVNPVIPSNIIMTVQYLPIFHIRSMSLEKNGILYLKTDYTDVKIEYGNDAKSAELLNQLMARIEHGSSESSKRLIQ